MLNFETVKYFTAEDYEKQRFADAVSRYQVGTVHMQGSLSILNSSQQLLLQTCMATALSLAALGIKERMDCCMEVAGCESTLSECCRNVDAAICPGGLQVGDFVTVLSYIGQLFAPLNYLGSVYNAVIMALIDLSNLAELLAESPDVVDSPDAFALPPTNISQPDIAVEFGKWREDVIVVSIRSFACDSLDLSYTFNFLFVLSCIQTMYTFIIPHNPKATVCRVCRSR
jgi:ATP-binding cassette, subfamily B, heavy metal transporter